MKTAIALLAVLLFVPSIVHAKVYLETAGQPVYQGLRELTFPSPMGSLNADSCAQGGPVLLASNCIRPIKPILPIKPYWCQGTWTLILHCEPFPVCNCVWVPTCLEQ